MTDRKSTLITLVSFLVLSGLAIAGLILHKTSIPQYPDFISMVSENAQATELVSREISIGNMSSWYNRVSVTGIELGRYAGNQYLQTGEHTWYYPLNVNNLKYLILKTDVGAFSLWVFSHFKASSGKHYTYGDILSTVYNVDTAEQIVSIEVSPTNIDNSHLGKSIQNEIGTHIYSDPNDISIFYSVIAPLKCYDPSGYSPSNYNRFTYSFSTDSRDKWTTGEIAYGTRYIKITLADGTVSENLIYDALNGYFWQFGSIETEPLANDAVYALNKIFEIK